MTEAASSAAAGGARSTPEPALLLTIRPSLSIPDIHLDLLSPSTTRVAKLKQQVRERLGPTYARHRIRLIYQGRILADSAVLGAVVKPPPPPPRDDDDVFSPAGHAGSKSSAKGKGMSLLGKGKNKAGTASRIGDEEEGTEMDELLPKGQKDSQTAQSQPSAKAKGKKPLPAPVRVFINASIGDALPSADLDAERKLAAQPVVRSSSGPGTSRSPRHPGGVGPAGEGPSFASSGTGQGGQGHSSTTLPAPRGFDRLLATGFTRSEVSALRLQFRSIQASRHTADTMPSPDTLRNMEDAWIDSNAFEPTAGDPSAAAAAPAAAAGWTRWFGGGGGSGGGGGGGGAGEDAQGAGAMEDAGDEPHRLLDILIPAMAIGFFFPLGTFGWLARQHGLWSPKWQFLALLGFFCSVLIGIVRTLAGDG